MDYFIIKYYFKYISEAYPQKGLSKYVPIISTYLNFLSIMYLGVHPA